jgi:hypothetical protein
MTDRPPIRRQCQHVKDNGKQCRKDALPGMRCCKIASHRRAALWRTRIVNFGRKWWGVITTCLTLVVALPTLYGYLIRISVAPYSTIRSHEPMGTVFNVTNNGVFDLHNVTESCNLIDVTDLRSHQFFRNVRLVPSNYALRNLPAGATKSLSCEHTVAGFHGEASIAIVITFSASPLPWYRRSETFPFYSEQADEGIWVWKTQ